MENKNQIYVCEWKGENQFDGESHFCIVVAANNQGVARDYVKDKIGIDVQPTWLMNGEYPTIYTSDGSKPLPVQAKILYNGNFHTYHHLTSK